MHSTRPWISYAAIEDIQVPLYIKDDQTAELVARLAKRRGLSKQEAVRQAVSAELKRIEEDVTLRDRLKKFWQENPLPPSTGLAADKAFFDDLSGEES